MSERVLAAGVLHEESGALVYVRIFDVEFELPAAEADGPIELLRVAGAPAHCGYGTAHRAGAGAINITDRLVRFEGKVCVSSDLEVEAAIEIDWLRAEAAQHHRRYVNAMMGRQL